MQLPLNGSVRLSKGWKKYLHEDSILRFYLKILSEGLVCLEVLSFRRASRVFTFEGSTFEGSTFEGSTFEGSTFEGSTFNGFTEV